MGNCASKVRINKPKKETGVISAQKKIEIKRTNLRLQYQIEDKIREDYSGTIFRVIDKLTNEVRALKSIPTEEDDIDSVMHEVSILQQIDHPNILKIIDVYLEAHSLNIITEYCTGGELLEKISKHGQFTEKILCEYSKQIISAILYLHSLGIIHKQLNPECILVSDDSENSELKLVNFGRNKKEKQEIHFKAPETFSGNYTKASDIWSVGIIVYLMACGKLPFSEAQDPQEYFMIIKTTPIEFTGRVWGRLSTEFKDLLKAMLDINPDKRPTARQIFDNEWFKTQSNSTNGRRLSKRSLFHLNNYTKQSKFKRALLGLMMNKITIQENIKKYQKIFKSIDKNGDGVLSVDEILEGLKQANLNISNPLKLIRALDNDKSGEISYSEFLTALVDWEKELSLEKLRKAFNEIDTNKDGSLSSQELMAVLGTDYKEDEFANFIKEADINGDGKIDFEEFCVYLKGNI